MQLEAKRLQINNHQLLNGPLFSIFKSLIHVGSEISQPSGAKKPEAKGE